MTLYKKCAMIILYSVHYDNQVHQVKPTSNIGLT